MSNAWLSSNAGSHDDAGANARRLKQAFAKDSLAGLRDALVGPLDDAVVERVVVAAIVEPELCGVAGPVVDRSRRAPRRGRDRPCTRMHRSAGCALRVGELPATPRGARDARGDGRRVVARRAKYAAAGRRCCRDRALPDLGRSRQAGPERGLRGVAHDRRQLRRGRSGSGDVALDRAIVVHHVGAKPLVESPPGCATRSSAKRDPNSTPPRRGARAGAAGRGSDRVRAWPEARLQLWTTTANKIGELVDRPIDELGRELSRSARRSVAVDRAGGSDRGSIARRDAGESRGTPADRRRDQRARMYRGGDPRDLVDAGDLLAARAHRRRPPLPVAREQVSPRSRSAISLRAIRNRAAR